MNSNSISIQVQKTTSGTVTVNSPVIFNNIVLNTSNLIQYNTTSGTFTLLQNSVYEISWSVATQSALGNSGVILELNVLLAN